MSPKGFDAHYRAHSRAVFGLCYRMTGVAADADELVQETFERLLEKPPNEDRPIRPWLITVATRLSIDRLRKREREAYHGPWLVGPVPSEAVAVDITAGPERRYELMESVTSAFLLALQALEPRARAVLVMRDVLGLRGVEVAEALELSPQNVRVILHRSRRALEHYDRDRAVPDTSGRAQNIALLRRLAIALAAGDPSALIAVLREDATCVHDGGGEVIAAVRPLRGPDQIVQFYANVAAVSPPPTWVRELDLNAMPALAVTFPPRPARYAERAVVAVDHQDDAIRRIRVVMARRKLAGVDFGS